MYIIIYKNIIYNNDQYAFMIYMHRVFNENPTNSMQKMTFVLFNIFMLPI